MKSFFPLLSSRRAYRILCIVRLTKEKEIQLNKEKSQLDKKKDQFCEQMRGLIGCSPGRFQRQGECV